jgi:hypothetical protein
MPDGSDRRNALPFYVTVILALGAALLVGGWARVAAFEAVTSWTTLSYWFVLSLAAECFWLETRTRAGMISMSFAVNMATVFVLPPHLVLTIGALSVWTSDLFLHRRSALRALFNASQTTISLGASIAVIRLLAGLSPPPGSGIFIREPIAVVAAPIVFVLLNTFTVSGAISLHSHGRFWEAWRENYGHGYHFLSCGMQFLLGLSLVAAAESVGYLSGLFSLLLFFFVRDAYGRFIRATLSHRPRAQSG